MDAPHITFWKGKVGNMSIIKKAILMCPNQQRVIKRTLEEILMCIREGVIFDGKIESKNKFRPKIIILPDSVEEILITNWMDAFCVFLWQ